MAIPPDVGMGLRDRRRRWASVAGQEPEITVGLLASFTADRLVPYLGARLADWGIPAEITVGPFNQIVQQCLDGSSRILRADALVVAPRCEDMSAGDLMLTADTALTACDRSQGCLVFVLPAIPQSRCCGVADAAAAGGTVTAATAARERLRAILAGHANVCIADAEEAVRYVGTRSAYRPELFGIARIPYTEEVSDRLAEQIARLLRVRYRGGCRLIVLDGDSIATDGDGQSQVAALRAHIARYLAAGVRIGVRSSAGDGWCPLLASLPELHDAAVTWLSGPQPPAAQLRRAGARLSIPIRQITLLTSDEALPAEAAAAGAGCVLLGAEPAAWAATLAEAAALDVAPCAAPMPGGTGPPPAAAGAGPSTRLTMAEYLGGLRVAVSFADLPGGIGEQGAALIESAHDFTLGTGVRTGGDGGFAFTATVRDRLGDYGLGAVVAAACDGPGDQCRVQVFSLSCPVLGRGVEDLVLREILRRADARNCPAVTFEYRETGRNGVTVDFLRRHSHAPWLAPSGRAIHVAAVPAADPPGT